MFSFRGIVAVVCAVWCGRDTQSAAPRRREAESVEGARRVASVRNQRKCAINSTAKRGSNAEDRSQSRVEIAAGPAPPALPARGSRAAGGARFSFRIGIRGVRRVRARRDPVFLSLYFSERRSRRSERRYALHGADQARSFVAQLGPRQTAGRTPRLRTTPAIGHSVYTQ